MVTVFNTIDNGLVYIDTVGAKSIICDLVIGKKELYTDIFTLYKRKHHGKYVIKKKNGLKSI